MSWVFRNSEARLGARLVLLSLADHAKDDGTYSWPSVPTLAHETRMDERSVQRALRSLIAMGAITFTGRSKAGTSIFTVNMDVSKQTAQADPGLKKSVKSDAESSTVQPVGPAEGAAAALHLVPLVGDDKLPGGDNLPGVTNPSGGVTNRAKGGGVTPPEPSLKQPSEDQPSKTTDPSGVGAEVVPLKGDEPVVGTEVVLSGPVASLELLDSPADAGTLVAYFVDTYREECSMDPPSRVKGHVASAMKRLLNDDIDPEVIEGALKLMIDRRLNPASLDSLILEAAAGPRRPTEALRYGRGMTTTQILQKYGGMMK